MPSRLVKGLYTYFMGHCKYILIRQLRRHSKKFLAEHRTVAFAAEIKKEQFCGKRFVKTISWSILFHWAPSRLPREAQSSDPLKASRRSSTGVFNSLSRRENRLSTYSLSAFSPSARDFLYFSSISIISRIKWCPVSSKKFLQYSPYVYNHSGIPNWKPVQSSTYLRPFSLSMIMTKKSCMSDFSLRGSDS